MLDFGEVVDSYQSLAPIKKKLVCNSEKNILWLHKKLIVLCFKLYLYNIQNTFAQKIFDTLMINL